MTSKSSLIVLLFAAAAPLAAQTVPAHTKPTLLQQLTGGGVAPERLNALFTGSSAGQGEAVIVLVGDSGDKKEKPKPEPKQEPKEKPEKKENATDRARRVEQETRERPAPRVKAGKWNGTDRATDEEVTLGGKG